MSTEPSGGSAHSFIDTVASIFRKSLASKLRTVCNYCASAKPSYRVGDEVICVMHTKQNGGAYFSASVITSASHLGDISGRYTFFTSPHFENEETALNNLTQEVALANIKHPEKIFLRYSADITRFFAGNWIDNSDRAAQKINLMTNNIQ